MVLGKQIVRSGIFALALNVGSALAETQSGQVRLENNADLTWLMFESSATPALGIALPATVSWENRSFDGPVKIDLSTNYAAFIEQWELALYRESDSHRKHPLRQWRGPAAAFDAGVVWDGTVETGPSLRPGETVVALLRVRDIAGNVDEAEPQTMLVSRYLMPAQRRDYRKITNRRRNSVAAGNPPAQQTIPVSGYLLDVRIAGDADAAPMHVAGLAMDDEGGGNWHLSQILPAGDYTLKIQTERPILGGSRLVSVGRLRVDVPSGGDHFALVKGTGELKRSEHSIPAQGMTGDGAISGRDAARLTLRVPKDPVGRYALAILDPSKETALYRDRRKRSVVRVDPKPRDIPWGSKQDPVLPSKPIKMRARFPAKDARLLTLPHTDLNAEKLFVSLRSDNVSPTYLNADQHFDLEPLQGKLFFTQDGQAAIEAFAKAARGEAKIDVAYYVRPSIAGMSTLRPEGEMFLIADNGGGGERLFEKNSPGSRNNEAPEPGWFSRTFGWLMAD